ncbi:hypothetical protein CEXT_186851 [Caerostris extrusa]|uniref:Uncharacterized protein n=1 Tax=Caerostris extrusa TaxID=172846 RepID=A0AAV4X8M3_CAEEX|nr:hypothetical protein CEXT_186851 [Caerostris extrusa]
MTNPSLIPYLQPFMRMPRNPHEATFIHSLFRTVNGNHTHKNIDFFPGPRTVPPATHNGDFCYSDKHPLPPPTDLIPAPCSPGCTSQQLVVHNYLCSPGGPPFPSCPVLPPRGELFVELMDVDTWPLTSRDAPNNHSRNVQQRDFVPFFSPWLSILGKK